jgi:hypothetical protein
VLRLDNGLSGNQEPILHTSVPFTSYIVKLLHCKVKKGVECVSKFNNFKTGVVVNMNILIFLIQENTISNIWDIVSASVVTSDRM